MKQNRKKSPFGLKLQEVTDLVHESRQKDITVTSLSGSAQSLLISLLLEHADLPLLLIAENYEKAEQIQQDLEFFCDPSEVNFFPHWDTLPYDNQSPDKDVLAIRFRTLMNILNQTARVVVTTPNALMQHIMPTKIFLENCFRMEVGSSYPREDLSEKLVRMGYIRVDMVEEKGEFSIRGEIIDLYPIGEEIPFRLDFFDDELESIKTFDVETQRSSDSWKAIDLYPALELLYSDDTVENALNGLIPLKVNTVPQQYHHIVEQIQNRVSFSGMESLLPIFYPETPTLLDYFHQKQLRIVFLDHARIESQSKSFFNEVISEYEYSRQEGNPTLPPDRLFLTFEMLIDRLEHYSCLDFQQVNDSDVNRKTDLSTMDNSAIRSLSISPGKVTQSPTRNVLQQLIEWHRNGAKIAIAAENQSKGEQIRQMLEEMDISAPVLDESSIKGRKEFLLTDRHERDYSFCIFTVHVNSGFRWVDSLGDTGVILITDEEIFGPKQKQRRVKKSNLKHFFSSLGDLKVGDYVVHVEYGIGKYEGLKKISAGQSESDFLVISYQGGDKVYVPVDKFNLVQNYTGGEGGGRARLNKLGDKAWTKAKSKVRSEVDDIADELIRIYAEREARKGIAFSKDSTMMNEFALSFPYQETEDQESTIQEVFGDMESQRPMDRLVCGDVGFGKTEIAMRAAFKAVIDSFQVGVLVPTTILAQQHYENFKKRFRDLPVRIGLVSRFQTPKQIRETKKALKEGELDIIIGTHRLLSKDIDFKKLGLLVVDEEQRFGVKHKEAIKKYRSTVDSLTLTATPIPRTLHMSMVGIRDISVINTAPMDRRAIRTRLVKFSDYVITEAVNRELRRGGQVYFIHNRVESIYQVGEYLNQLLPKVKISVAHGQMSERDLENVMMDFIEGESDILLATTIVESGLDISNVNTILINNADQFGLSQLYQLRGRVGRSNQQAYAYLLTPREKVLSEDARKRLTILQELNHLGAGFKIASHDLELRGAGNLLGSKQSGHIAAIGFELYTAMVDEAVQKLRQGDAGAKDEDREIKLNMNFEANLPDSYIASMNQRLDAYKSISSCKTEEELWEVRSSLEDRYGKLPKQTVALFVSMQIKILIATMQILQLNQGAGSIEMLFSEAFQPDPVKLMGFLNNTEYSPKLLPNNGIQASLSGISPEGVLRFLMNFKKEIFSDKAEI